MRIAPAETPSQWRYARDLVEEYIASLDADLGFQDYESEIANLPAQYGHPTGRLLLAEVEVACVGCVGLRRLDADVCEMKRLYVRLDFQRQGIGRALVEAIIGEARQLGYARMRLDTWPSMIAARALYRDLGFKEIPAYRYNPNEQTSFVQLIL